MIRANALLVVPMDRPDVSAGETLTALPLGEAPARDVIFAM
jgi:hypothetical protein